MPSFDEVSRSKYVLLTTFTKDGRPKPTPVWGAPDGNRLLVITDDGSWKTRRIQNTPRVTIQKCGVRGKPKGEPVEAIARVLPKSETRRVYDAVVKRYWWRHRQGAHRLGGQSRTQCLTCCGFGGICGWETYRR
ncbi:F420-dependent protein [Segniliparus rotundus DSM] [Mycobacterium shimoidei]|uniref:F420-dependent protein [Segniliparus rotundus DSM] n=1 Tax=Mycobacterium shimoidei TaxID=29313 RepID=A0A375Z4M6_MYCSH|nr:F420-dependent protein [Segniliparus rotundus DSM] [Mycobacterium shimoidei]